MKRLLPKLMLLVLALGAAAVLVELLFRFVLLQPRVPETEEHFQRSIAADWPEPRPYRKPAGAFRIVCLGDSFNEAGGYDNYVYQAERILRRTHPNVELVNIGLGGLELLDQFQLYRKFVFRFQPDLVVHGLFVGNDFYVPRGKLLLYKQLLVRKRQGLAGWHPRHWVAWRWLSRYARQRAVAAETRRQREAGVAAGLLGEARFLEAERARLELCKRGDAAPEVRWAYMERIVDKYHDLAVKLDVPYAVILHPDQYQVERPLRQRLFERFQIAPGDYDPGLPQQFLRDLFARKGIPALDLLPAFREAGAEGGLYRLHDTHYNDAGNALAGKRLAEFLDGHIPAPGS